MEKTQMLALAAVAIIAVAAIGAGAYFLTKDDGDSGEVTDSVGNVIDTTKTYSKIASTTAVGTEVVCDLGLRANIVGATNSAHIYDMTTHVSGVALEFDYPSTMKADIDSGKIAKFKWNWSSETVAATNPDLVLLDPSSVATDDSKMKQLQALGITCFVLWDENNWEDIGKNYKVLGKVLDKYDRAKEIVKAGEKADAKIMEKFKDQSSKKIAYVCYCYGTYYIYDSSGLMDAALKLGCTNAMASDKTSTITAEQILSANPDFIIFDDMGTSLDWNAVIAEWKADPVMNSIPAIANNKFYCMEATPFQATSYPTIHYVMGEGLVATMIYPDVAGVTITGNVITEANYVGYLSWLDA